MPDEPIDQPTDDFWLRIVHGGMDTWLGIKRKDIAPFDALLVKVVQEKTIFNMRDVEASEMEGRIIGWTISGWQFLRKHNAPPSAQDRIAEAYAKIAESQALLAAMVERETRRGEEWRG